VKRQTKDGTSGVHKTINIYSYARPLLSHAFYFSFFLFPFTFPCQPLLHFSHFTSLLAKIFSLPRSLNTHTFPSFPSVISKLDITPLTIPTHPPACSNSLSSLPRLALLLPSVRESARSQMVKSRSSRRPLHLPL